jgi:hypothetical protein
VGFGILNPFKETTVQIDQAGRPGQLKRVNGVLVFTGPDPLESGEALVAQSHDERIDDLSVRFSQRDPLSKHGRR